MSRSRRPSISIHDYPEHLNPFNDNSSSIPTQTICRDNKSSSKETKNKFWTFGRSRKKRSQSFSIKSTWNGMFGKCKEVPEVPGRRSMITTVSTTYKSDTNHAGQNGRPLPQPQVSRDQQEFNEALGTLARRRKYTLDNGSRYNSSLTVNGDPTRIYEGNPQDITTSIMGDLTPKPPARKFGQLSPRSTDKIPTLDFEDKDHLSNEDLVLEDREPDRAPVPPRRSGLRSSQKFTPTLDLEEEDSKSGDVTLRDENENMPEEYIFKRFSHDAVRKSNLSINSCMSISSTASAYGRKKRRAPQPPKLQKSMETKEENNIGSSEPTRLEPTTASPIEISQVSEDINELTKKSQQIEEDSIQRSSPSLEDSKAELPKEIIEVAKTEIKNSKENLSNDPSSEMLQPRNLEENSESEKSKSEESPQEKSVEIEYRREAGNLLEIIKEITPPEELRKKKSPAISRSNSFCVKEEIEKIEKQIKNLEAQDLLRRNSADNSTDCNAYNARLSIQENRRHFFQELVDDSARVKVELKELPREQTDIHIIKLTDPPVPIDALNDPVKVIELHISEPIRHRPELVLDNSIPKLRRSSALGLERKPSIRDTDQDNSYARGSSL